MRLQVTANIQYEATMPSTLLLSIQPCIFERQLVTAESLCSDLILEIKELLSDTGEKRMKAIQIMEPGTVSFSYSATVENKSIPIPAEKLFDVPIGMMPVVALSYLIPSRYCQSDRLYKFAYNKFGQIGSAFQK